MISDRTEPTKTAVPPKFVCVVFTIVALVAVAGINFIEWLKEDVICFPDPNNWFNSLFVVTANNEPAGLYLLLGFSVVAFIFLLKKRFDLPIHLSRGIAIRKVIGTLAIASFLISLAGTWSVTHHYPLACDEYMPEFQGKIFLSGNLRSEIPERLRFAAHALAPLQAIRSPGDTHWNSSYLPIYSALRTPFLALHLETLVNPLFGVLAIVSMAGIIRLLWPAKPWLAVAGAAMIALSPQILVNDMTVYSMPAHLALNLVWFWLYLQPTKKRFWLAPLVGVIALGLHTPFVHALFVLPFLFRLIADRHWKAVFIFGIIYLAGCIAYWYWWHVFAPGNAAPSGPLLSWHGKRILMTQPLNVLNIFSWNTLPCVILAMIALRFYTSLPIPVRDGTMSCLLTFTFYAFILFDQSYGWGNRYFYGVLGCFILLAVAGLDQWASYSQDQRPLQFFLFGIALTLLVSIPLRLFQVEKFIRPFANAWEHFQRTDVDLLVFDSRMGWNVGDLLRNSPMLDNKPLIANQRHITIDDAIVLKKLFPRIHFVTREELASYGISTVSLEPKKP